MKRIANTGISILFLFFIFIINSCSKPEVDSSPKWNDQSYLFIISLINDNTGLVDSIEYDHYTTVYKNALAAMAFIFEKDYVDAENIFDFFNSKYNHDVLLKLHSSFLKGAAYEFVDDPIERAI